MTKTNLAGSVNGPITKTAPFDGFPADVSGITFED
jgi:hypothetical protein